VLVMYPLDVVKTRLQLAHGKATLGGVCRDIIKNEGYVVGDLGMQITITAYLIFIVFLTCIEALFRQFWEKYDLSIAKG
jgi:hypothetical protein